jgi:hypothetical protein
MPDSAHDAVEFRLPSAGDDHRSPFLGEALSDRFTNARVAAGYDGNLPL